MYPRFSWELVADPLGSAKHSLGTTVLARFLPVVIKKKPHLVAYVHGNVYFPSGLYFLGYPNSLIPSRSETALLWRFNPYRTNVENRVSS